MSPRNSIIFGYYHKSVKIIYIAMESRKIYMQPLVVRILPLPLTSVCTASYTFEGDTGTEDVDIYGPEL